MNNLALHDHFLAMVRMRAFEEACIAGSTAREIHGELHTGVGQEAIAAGMTSSLRPGDALVSTHRNHLHALAKGVCEHALMAEIFEKETGLCRGRGGHMHPFDPDNNFSATGIVGSALPVALGYAYAFAMDHRDDIAIGVTGDGGANGGAFHECLNMAAAWKLPFLVLVENNSYAISVPADAVTAPVPIAARADAYGARGITVDGTDVEAVAAAFAEAAAHLRGGKGPVVLEAFCQRFRGHYEGDADSYRPHAERRRMRRENDPILIARARLEAIGVAATDLDAGEAQMRDEIAAILAAVRAEPMPNADGALRYRFRDIAEGAAA